MLKRKKIKSLLLIFIFLVLVTSCSCSCMGNKDRIYLLNFKPESASAFKKVAKAYEKETGIEVKVETAASGKYEETLTSEMLKSEVPTIFSINGPAGLRTWKEYALPLNDTEQEGYNKLKLHENLENKEYALSSGETIYGLPIALEGYGLIYNKKVFDEYFKQENKATTLESINDVKSYNDLVTIVEDLSKYIKGDKVAKNASAIEKLEGVFAPVSLKAGSDWPYHTHLSSIAMFHEFTGMGENFGGIDTQEIEFKYNKNMQNIFDLYMTHSAVEKNKLGDVSYDDSLNAFATGKAAIIQQGNWIYSSVINNEDTTIEKDDLGMIPIYMGIEGEEAYGLAVGTENFWAINKNASKEKINASIDFINWLFTSEKGMKYVTEELGFITPYSNFTTTPTDPLAKSVLESIKSTETKPVTWSFSYYPTESFKTDFGGNLLDYAIGKHTWEDVVSKVVTSWKDAFKK